MPLTVAAVTDLHRGIKHALAIPFPARLDIYILALALPNVQLPRPPDLAREDYSNVVLN